MKEISWIANEMEKNGDGGLELMEKETIEKARRFHKSFPQYSVTPLVGLSHMARYLGLGGLYVKDESKRFGLNAFKVLGGSFAMANFIAQKLGVDVGEVSFELLTDPETKKKLGEITFYTATDGNHGRGVAWAANKINQNSVIHMPKGSQEIRLRNILKEGAKATIEDVNYDECVRIANAESLEDPNGVMVQDTAWEGYEKIPTWIMQGYGTMAMEAAEQLNEMGVERPTHIFVQAGVGSLAGAVQGFFAGLYPDDPPVVSIVEADEAACIFKSAKAGEIEFVTGDMPTIMAGLACGEPNTISWEILKNNSAFFISCPDWVSAKGMRMLGNPLKGDEQIISGESGAVSMGLLSEVMGNERYRDLKEALGLNEDSKVLMFSTEGDTDPENYRNIVWNGYIPSYNEG